MIILEYLNIVNKTITELTCGKGGKNVS